MGKASRKKKAREAASAALEGVAVDSEARGQGEEAMVRLLRSNQPGRLSLAGAYVHGYVALWQAQQETEPYWFQEIDPLDALFLGTAWPRRFRDGIEFANARDAWLRLLRGTVHEKGVQRFVREAVLASEELGLPVDDYELMLALIGRLEAAGLDQRRLPRRLLPEESLQGCRAVFGLSADVQLPEPLGTAKKQIRRFWNTTAEESRVDDTPCSVLRSGLHRFAELGLPTEEMSVLLLPALYAALLAKPAEHLAEDLSDHAVAWALAQDEASTLVPVLDILLAAPALELSTTDALGRLFAVPAFTEPIPSSALLWTSSPGLALPRLAFELGIPKVSTLDTEITPDLLDWVGTRNRMHLSAAAREDADPLDEPDEPESAISTPEETSGGWEERREAVRRAVEDKVRKKATETTAAYKQSDSGVERVWNADGSSVVRFSPDTAQGRETQEALMAQLVAFREKFGREPEPHDPLFFDPDEDVPVPLTKEFFDNALLEMAERAAETGIDPALILASRDVGYMVTEENQSMFTMAEVFTFSRAVARHRKAAG